MQPKLTVILHCVISPIPGQVAQKGESLKQLSKTISLARSRGLARKNPWKRPGSIPEVSQKCPGSINALHHVVFLRSNPAIRAFL